MKEEECNDTQGRDVGVACIINGLVMVNDFMIFLMFFGRDWFYLQVRRYA
jgi:hypothetical protein